MSVKPGTTQKSISKKATGKSSWNEMAFQELAENVSDGVYFINADGYFRYVNRALSERSGIPQERYPSLHFLDVIDPNYREPAKENFQRILKGEDGIPYELRFKDANGQVRVVEVHSRPVRDGRKIIGICGISREITKRKLAEELLHQSEARYRAVVEDQAELICRYLPDCTLTFVNNAYCHYFGKTRDELLGQKFQTLITGQERKMMGKRLAALTPEEPTAMHEQRALAAGDEVRWQQWVTRALFDEKKTIKELQAVGRDITMQKIAEEALKASEVSLAKLVKERTVELESKSKMLEELNIALKVLLRRSGDDRTEMEDRLTSNIKSLILPYVEKIKSGALDTHQKSCLGVIESNLNEIISPFVRRMRHCNFTPRELTVASLIKDGKTTKEIAEILGVGTHAIDSHRNRIRKKTGLTARKSNLQSHLRSLE
jgi:PAS domain S-box-containing protein